MKVIKSIVSPTILACILLLPFPSLSAELKVFKISESFSAPFPEKPEYIGTAGEGKRQIKIFMYGDKENARAYTVAYPLHAHKFKESVVDQALRYHVKGLMTQYVEPHLESVENIKIGENRAIKFIVSFHLPSDPTVVHRKYAVSIYKAGKIYQWSINENALNTERAEQIFNENYKRVRVK